MRPVQVNLWVLLALAALTPAFATILPAKVFNAAFLAAFAIPALVTTNLFLRGRSAVVTDGGWALRWGVVFLAVQVVSLYRGFAFSSSPDIRIACQGLLMYVGMIALAVGSAHVISTRTALRIDVFDTVASLLGLYCALNLLLWAVGVSNQLYQGATTDRSQFLALLGISANRVLFPLSWGVNNFGVVAGVTLAIGLVKHYRHRQHRLRNFALLVASPLLCCLLSDSRAAIFCAVLAAVATLKFPRMSAKGIVLFWIFGAAVVVLSEAGPLFSFGARDSSGGTFTGRELIWAAGVMEFSTFKMEHIFGYGQFGQFDSGAYQLYEMLFQGYSDRPELISLHNTYLQVGMDTGWVGLAALFAFLFTAIRKLGLHAREEGWPYSGGLAALMFLAANGLTEVTLSLYQPWVFLVLTAIISMFRKKAVAMPGVQYRPIGIQC